RSAATVIRNGTVGIGTQYRAGAGRPPNVVHATAARVRAARPGLAFQLTQSRFNTGSGVRSVRRRVGAQLRPALVCRAYDILYRSGGVGRTTAASGRAVRAAAELRKG